jgi:hypothetical protein
MNSILLAIALASGAAPARPGRPFADLPTGANVQRSNDERRRAARPKTVRDFFNLLPQKYFTLEGCAPGRDKDCARARAEYLKNYLEVEDTANGYMKGGCDGAQSCFQMALFKRPDGTYVVGLTIAHEAGEQSYFLEYEGGDWRDIGTQVVPEDGEDKVYELPRYGTTVAVYENEKVSGEEYRQRGRKLYDLVWKGGRFIKK